MTTTMESASAGLASDRPATVAEPVCEHRGCVQTAAEDVATLASAVTLIRTIGCSGRTASIPGVVMTSLDG